MQKTVNIASLGLLFLELVSRLALGSLLAWLLKLFLTDRFVLLCPDSTYSVIYG